MDTGTKIFNILKILITLVTLSACTQQSDNVNRVYLYKDFISHQSKEQFKTAHPDFQIDLNANSNTSNLAIEQFIKTDYELSNQLRGRMIVIFINDSLMKLIFYPENCSNHQTFLSKYTEHGDLDSIEIKVDIDYKKSCYISWVDKRLLEKFNYMVR